LQKSLFGLVFKNPVGLAAGFDKNANVFNEFESFGFGFIEIGTVTPMPQYGNQKPRLFRLKMDNALINRMGFNNDGIEKIVKRLKNKKTNIIIGGNIGKNKITPNEAASSDYKDCLQKIAPHVDYLVLNISSPNTPGLVELQNKKGLKSLLSVVQEINQKEFNKPLLIKISPDLTLKQIDHILTLVKEYNIAGIIATNTSSNRDNLTTRLSYIDQVGAGGLSGRPLFVKSKKVVSYISKKTSGQLPIIAVGGISCANDALEMFNSGASLVQVYTGFIYKGPSLVRDIKKKLLDI
jgi:dihydroorotate dehydrogenase